jgi:dihydrodipicolinate synthase/N-acetylneuraminate lyase
MAGSDFRETLRRGVVIPAHPLALDANRRLDERRQRALTRYYLAAGAGGVAIGVHTTQFAIREPRFGLYRPVLELAAEELDRGPGTIVRIAGICGPTEQAVREAELACELQYDAGLLSLGALRDADDERLLEHCRAVAEVLPIIGFYLQPSVGGRTLAAGFWRRFAEIDAVAAIKIAPFNRYQTLDVIRAVCEAGREDIALYTGNDDNIVADLVTPFEFGGSRRRIVGGLLGQWAVGTRRAVQLLNGCQQEPASPELLGLGVQLTDLNAALFDAAHSFRGCIPGIHEVLRRQGLLAGNCCLDADEQLSPGQSAEIDRTLAAYPHLSDDEFIAEHRDQWLSA